MTNLEKLTNLISGLNETLKDQVLCELPVDDDTDSQVRKQKDAFETLASGFERMKTLKDTEYIEIPEEAFAEFRECLLMKPYKLHDEYKLREDLTEEELLPFAADIENKNLDALKSFFTIDKAYISNDFVLFKNFYTINQIIFELALALAHRAKHVNSRSAGESLLRAASIANRFTRNFTSITEDSVDELLALIESGLEDMEIATDYLNLKPWSEYVMNLPDLEVK